MKLINYALPIFLLMVSVTGLAQSDASKPMAPGHGFAPIVYEVCKGKKAGDAVQIKTPDGSVDAVCMETSRGLAAGPGKALGEDSSTHLARRPCRCTPLKQTRWGRLLQRPRRSQR